MSVGPLCQVHIPEPPAPLRQVAAHIDAGVLFPWRARVVRGSEDHAARAGVGAVPVIRLDISTAKAQKDADALRHSLVVMLAKYEKVYGRNAPCPCCSGKKYKTATASHSNPPSGSIHLTMKPKWDESVTIPLVY